MNTQIDYLYRDAHNYKVWNRCVIHGVLSENQQKIILKCLSDGEFFIPSQVGLPEEKFDSFDPESDHPWFELGKFSFSTTHVKPTVEITAVQLVHAFARAKGRWEADVHSQEATRSLSSLIQDASSRLLSSKEPSGSKVYLRSNVSFERY